MITCHWRPVTAIFVYHSGAASCITRLPRAVDDQPASVGSVSNRLASATSPYLLQHADNPVHWWEWGPEAFAEAKRRDTPILLSIGYAACHWCHEVDRSTAVGGI